MQEDWIDRNKEVDIIANYITSANKGISISINGSWGSGKTWVLDTLEAKLKDTIGVIRYNAWEHELYNEPFTSLYQSVYSYIYDVDESFRTRKSISDAKKGFTDALKVVTPFVTRFLLGKAIDLSKLGEGKDSFINLFDNISDTIFTDLKKKNDSISEFKNILNGHILKLKKPDASIPPLALFIDELDRCNPAYIMTFLQSIFHFFDTDNLIIVFALDINQVYSAINHFYGEKCRPDGYLRKIIDIQHNLMDISEYAINNFLIKHREKNSIKLNTRINYEFNDLLNYDEGIRRLIRNFGLSLRDYEKLNSLLLNQEQNPMYKEIIGFSDLIIFYNIISLSDKNIIRKMLAHDLSVIDDMLIKYPFMVQFEKNDSILELYYELFTSISNRWTAESIRIAIFKYFRLSSNIEEIEKRITFCDEKYSDYHLFRISETFSNIFIEA